MYTKIERRPKSPFDGRRELLLALAHGHAHHAGNGHQGNEHHNSAVIASSLDDTAVSSAATANDDIADRVHVARGGGHANQVAANHAHVHLQVLKTFQATDDAGGSVGVSLHSSQVGT